MDGPSAYGSSVHSHVIILPLNIVSHCIWENLFDFAPTGETYLLFMAFSEFLISTLENNCFQRKVNNW